MREEEELGSIEGLRSRLLTYSINLSKSVVNKLRVIEAIKDKELSGVVIMNLISCIKKNEKLLYSRDKINHSPVKTKYDRRGITVHRLIKCVAILEELGYIHNFIGKAHKDKEKRIMSYITPSEYFIAEFCSKDEEVQSAIAAYNASLQTIILRNEYGKAIDYQDNKNIKNARKIVEKLNKINELYDIRDGDGNQMTNIYSRIFNKDFEHGGRYFHSDALKIKNKKTKARLDITINGEQVVEIDFSNLHYRITSLMEQISMENLPLDVYMDILPERLQDEDHRELIKLSINILFNSKTTESAERAINKEITRFKKQGWKIDKSLNTGSKLREHIYSMTPDFVKCYCRNDSFGLALQNADSWLAQRVIEKFVEEMKPILPIHDSFVVRMSDVGMLENIMGDAFREEFGIASLIPLKMSWKDVNVVHESKILA
nr:MAG TPA: DNA polymerase I [Caudoviricetes sp.]